MVKADKDAFPSYDPEVQAKRESTTFLQDFMIAERFAATQGRRRRNERHYRR